MFKTREVLCCQVWDSRSVSQSADAGYRRQESAQAAHDAQWCARTQPLLPRVAGAGAGGRDPQVWSGDPGLRQHQRGQQRPDEEAARGRDVHHQQAHLQWHGDPGAPVWPQVPGPGAGGGDVQHQWDRRMWRPHDLCPGQYHVATDLTDQP